jgi:hypothetical protein
MQEMSSNMHSRTIQRTKIARKVSNVVKQNAVYKKMVELEEETMGTYKQNSDFKQDGNC